MSKNNDMSEQISILATNFEILNQKINENPSSYGSDNSINNLIVQLYNKVQLIEDYIKSGLDTTQINNQIRELQGIIFTLKKFDKDWLNNLCSRLHYLNNSNQDLFNKTEKLSKDINIVLNKHSDDISKKVFKRMYKKLKKDNLLIMGFTSVLSSLVALVTLLTIMYFSMNIFG